MIPSVLIIIINIIIIIFKIFVNIFLKIVKKRIPPVFKRTESFFSNYPFSCDSPYANSGITSLKYSGRNCLCSARFSRLSIAMVWQNIRNRS